MSLNKRYPLWIGYHKIKIPNVLRHRKRKLNKKGRNYLIRRVGNKSLKHYPSFDQMNQLIFGGLLTTPAPTAPPVGIAFIVLFVIVGFMVGPNYDGMNATR